MNYVVFCLPCRTGSPRKNYANARRLVLMHQKQERHTAQIYVKVTTQVQRLPKKGTKVHVE